MIDSIRDCFVTAWDYAVEWIRFKAFPWIKRILIMWPELWGVPAVILKFFLWSGFLHWLDPTAATFDAGILHKPSVVMFNGACYNALAWLVIRLNFTPLFRFYKTFLLNQNPSFDWNDIRLKYTVGLYLGLFYCFSLMGAV
jgi:hypothetical protein